MWNEDFVLHSQHEELRGKTCFQIVHENLVNGSWNWNGKDNILMERRHPIYQWLQRQYGCSTAPDTETGHGRADEKESRGKRRKQWRRRCFVK